MQESRDSIFVSESVRLILQNMGSLRRMEEQSEVELIAQCMPERGRWRMR